MYKTGNSREQYEMLPASLDERIGKNHMVRVIDLFVEGLDLYVLGFRKSVTAATGRRPYNPGDLLKLYLYGYINRIRATRPLMRECERNIEVMWLINHLTPDFRTIADFRAFNKRSIRRAFKVFVNILRDARMLGEELTVDGTKIRASNGMKQSYTPELTAKKLAYIEEQVKQFEDYLNAMEENDRHETGQRLEIPAEEIPAKLAELKGRIAKHKGYEKRFKAGETQILTTDPECRTLHSKDGLHPAYNVQTVVETENHFITNYEVTTANTDQNQLSVMGEMVKEELKRDCVHLIADKGYDSRADIEKCVMNGIIPDVGLKYDKDERIFNLEYEKRDITQAQRESRKPEDIQACLHAGILPECYEGSNIAVEIQERSCLSCFIRHEDGTVTCPMGRQLYKHSDKKYGTKYGSQEACRTCPNRCTDSKDTKTVLIGYNSNVVPIYMYGNPKHPVQAIPQDAIISPNNHALHRKGRADKKVKLTIKRDIARQQVRKETAEHPFGTVKWYDGAYWFLCRGKEKVAAETALSYLSYNIRRAVNLTKPKDSGPPGILMLLKARKWEKTIG